MFSAGQGFFSSLVACASTHATNDHCYAVLFCSRLDGALLPLKRDVPYSSIEL
jgi:hypothetical protein